MSIGRITRGRSQHQWRAGCLVPWKRGMRSGNHRRLGFRFADGVIHSAACEAPREPLRRRIWRALEPSEGPTMSQDSRSP